MTIPTLSQDEFIKLLKDNGYNVVSDEFWQDHNRVLLKKGEGHSFPIPVGKNFGFPIVVKTCIMLGIEPPPDHKKCYDQWVEMRKNQFGIKKEKEQQEEE